MEPNNHSENIESLLELQRSSDRIAEGQQNTAADASLPDAPPRQPSAMASAGTGTWEQSADTKFIIVKWLYFMYILWNIVDTIACVAWFVFLIRNRYVQGLAWLPWLVWPVALFFNRLVYEIGIALFEAIKHLRQIRDELRKLGVR